MPTIPSFSPEDEEPSTNTAGVALGLAALPLVAAVVAAYIKVGICLVLHVWRLINF